MEQPAEESSEFDVERERLELERGRFALEQRTLHKNFGAIVTAGVAFTAVCVSLGQIAVAHITKQQELELSKDQLAITRLHGEKEAKLNEIEQERRWKLDSLNFVSDNMDLIFSERVGDRERIRGVMLAVLPRDITSALFKNFQEFAIEGTEGTWKDGRAAITRANYATWEGRWQVAFTGIDGIYRGILKVTLEEGVVVGVYNWNWKGREVETNLNGNASDDGFELKGTWESGLGEDGRFSFRLKDGERAFSGLYSTDKNLEPDNHFNVWSGFKIGE